MPLLLVIFYKIHAHYLAVGEQLSLRSDVEELEFSGNTVIVLVGNVTRVDIGAVNYARSIGTQVIAMHVATDENKEKEEEIRQEFQAHFPDIRLSVVHSSYRSIVGPVVRYVDLVSKNAMKHNHTTTVLVPQFVPNKRWQNILHNQTSVRIRYYLSWREHIVVANYSYHLKK
jgi:hypothetical protein